MRKCFKLHWNSRLCFCHW